MIEFSCMPYMITEPKKNVKKEYIYSKRCSLKALLLIVSKKTFATMFEIITIDLNLRSGEISEGKKFLQKK